MRLWGVAAASLFAWGCGQGGSTNNGSAAGNAASELTVTLPPTLPSTPAEQVDTAAVVPEPAPEAGFETVVAAAPKAAPVPERGTPAVEPVEDTSPAEIEVAVAPATEPEVPTSAGSTGGAANPAGSSNWAAYIRKAGFACDRVGAIERVDRSASPGFTYYRVQCGSGTYQATNKRGHLYFRRWQG